MHICFFEELKTYIFIFSIGPFCRLLDSPTEIVSLDLEHQLNLGFYSTMNLTISDHQVITLGYKY